MLTCLRDERRELEKIPPWRREKPLLARLEKLRAELGHDERFKDNFKQADFIMAYLRNNLRVRFPQIESSLWFAQFDDLSFNFKIKPPGDRESCEMCTGVETRDWHMYRRGSYNARTDWLPRKGSRNYSPEPPPLLSDYSVNQD
jgi:hypothetical protein